MKPTFPKGTRVVVIAGSPDTEDLYRVGDTGVVPYGELVNMYGVELVRVLMDEPRLPDSPYLLLRAEDLRSINPPDLLAMGARQLLLDDEA